MTTMIWVCAVLTVGLTAYSLGHYLCALVFLPARPRPREFPDHPEDGVAVLVPARNEGEAALRALRSLLDQDHHGRVEITLLLKDREDSCVPFLAQAFPDAELDAGRAAETPAIVELTRSDDRVAAVAFCGEDGKREKVNWMAARLDTPLAAILDSDHQAHADWLRTSVCLMKERGARIIQGRRHPLSARGFFPLWDSLHQHVGCELFNAAFTRLGLTVFFTGTTTVMETGLLKAHPFRRCITEDVDLSYDLLLEGVKIAYNPHSGSDEEVSPDLYSFLARRRRWANGHTDAFFRHLGRLWSAPIGWKNRAQFLFHGVHYLACVVVFVLHLIIGLIFVTELSPVGAGAAALSSVIIGVLIAWSQRSVGWGARLSEVVVVAGWFFPAVVIAMNLTLAIILGDGARAALPLPYALQAVGLVGLVAPLVLLLVGLAGQRQLGLGTFLGVVLSYPAAFYLDISGVLIGTVDYLSGRQHWKAVARAAAPPEVAAPGRAAGLTPTIDIRRSWRLGSVLVAAPGTLGRGLVRMFRPSRLIPSTLLAGLFCGGVLYLPDSWLQVDDVACQVLEHDGDPWIVPAAEMDDYCGPLEAGQSSAWTQRAGSYELLRHDDLDTVDPAFWDVLDDTFFCNEAQFSPDNVVPREEGGIRLHLEERATGERDYASGSIATKTDPDAQFLYGRFETVMKPARGSGVITAFFLYRFDPWQEIDAEFLGRDTTKMLINVFYNPGEEGDLYNYGYRGTPVLVDLGFDAAEDFHTYAIEWEAGEIRWFADDRLIHRRPAGRPTPVPHLPMRFHVNVWPICSEELAGPFDGDTLPTGVEIESVAISSWSPSPYPGLPRSVGSLFEARQTSDDWRDSAAWIQP